MSWCESGRGSGRGEVEAGALLRRRPDGNQSRKKKSGSISGELRESHHAATGNRLTEMILRSAVSASFAVML